LTGSDATIVRNLIDAADLWHDSGPGCDNTAQDGVFETLKIGLGRAAVHVTSCNPSFANGPKKALIDWLSREEETLRGAPPSPERR